MKLEATQQTLGGFAGTFTDTPWCRSQQERIVAEVLF
jgi:hypothetical protein